MLLSASLHPSALPYQPDPAHPYLSVVPLPSPRTIQLPTHDSSAPRRRPDGEVSPTTVWSRRWPALAGPSPAELSRLLTAPRGAYPAELLGGVPVVGRRCGQVGRDVRRTVRCRSLSTIGCPPGPVPRPVRCPAIRCPAIRCPTVGCPVAWVRRPGPACPPSGAARPVSSRLVSACPSRGVDPVPGQPAVALGTTPVRQGLHAGVGRVLCGLPRARAARRRLRRPGRRRRCGGRGSTGGGRVPVATWAGLRSG
jgi:hypothetical protein